MTRPSREPITRFSSPYVVLPADNVDTDQIIPARFLKTTDRLGLGPKAFYNWRYHADGSPKSDFPLNTREAAGAAILVAGHNFGCGSSREHAVWALLGAGLRAVVSSEFADIFRGNALANGLLPIQVDSETTLELMAGNGQLVVDLPSETLTLPDQRRVQFSIPPFAKYCLMNGLDEMGFLLDAADDIERYERARGPVELGR
jgi:3-isopropylmalate/(R)-2-methylmalate dehydratase small subunit